jgi:hypothetical protein
MGASSPALVADLVERFSRDRKACPVRSYGGAATRSRRVFLSPDYKEEQLRAEFLNPFFTALGWDVANKAGLTEVFRPVIHADDGSHLAAYSLRLSDSDSGRSAASRLPLVLANGNHPDSPYEFSVMPAGELGEPPVACDKSLVIPIRRRNREH